MKRYGRYIKPYLGALILGPLLMLIEVTGEIMLSELMPMAINNGVVQRNVRYILSVGGLMILATLVMAVGGIGRAYFSVKAAINFTSGLRADLFSKVQEFSFKNIDTYNTDPLVTRLANGIQQIQDVFMMGLRIIICALGMFIGALPMASMINARLAVVVLVVIPLLTAAITTILKTAFPRFTAIQKKLGQLNSGIQEALTSVRVIKSFVREGPEEDKFRAMNQGLENSSLDTMKIVTIAMPVMTPVVNIITLAVVQYKGNITIAEDMSVGDLTAFTTHVVQMLMSLMILSMAFLQLSRAVASIRRVSEVMDTEIGPIDQGTARKDLAILTGEMELKHVSFNYTDNQDEMVLEDTSFTVEPGQVIDIIGVIDSGETTLVQTIPRLCDVTKSQVLVDGVGVRDYSLKNLRGGAGVVLQKSVFFLGTIEENLHQGEEGAPMNKIREMAQDVRADSFITSFTNGYGIDMGQGGVNVSSGQKQGLCTAGALLKWPRILMLDDSTSAMDTATKTRMRQCFSTSFKDTTKIIIARRIGSAEEADRILALDEGRLIGQGIREQLMKGCQAYQEIYYSQRSRKEAAAS